MKVVGRVVPGFIESCRTCQQIQGPGSFALPFGLMANNPRYPQVKAGSFPMFV